MRRVLWGEWEVTPEATTAGGTRARLRWRALEPALGCLKQYSRSALNSLLASVLELGLSEILKL